MLLKKILAKSAAILCLGYAIQASASFQPLGSDDLKALTTTYVVPFTKVSHIKAELVRTLPDQIRDKMSPIALFSDFQEIGESTKNVVLSFQPNTYAPSIEIPTGFPLDMLFLVNGLFAREKLDLTPSDDFGTLTGNVIPLGTPYKIGSWVEKCSLTPSGFLKGLGERYNILSNITILAVCQKNRSLMDFISYVLEDDQTNLDEITFNRVKELSRLLAYAVGVNVEENSEHGVSLKVNKVKIQTRGKMKPEAYKKMLKTQTRAILAALHLSYDSEKHWLYKDDQ